MTDPWLKRVGEDSPLLGASRPSPLTSPPFSCRPFSCQPPAVARFGGRRSFEGVLIRQENVGQEDGAFTHRPEQPFKRWGHRDEPTQVGGMSTGSGPRDGVLKSPPLSRNDRGRFTGWTKGATLFDGISADARSCQRPRCRRRLRLNRRFSLQSALIACLCATNERSSSPPFRLRGAIHVSLRHVARARLKGEVCGETPPPQRNPKQ